MSETIKTIKAQLSLVDSLSDPKLRLLKLDKRKGVQLAVKQRISQLTKLANQRAAFVQRFRYEKVLWHQGVQYVAGVDEVGRGPLAGPVVAAAVILPADFSLIEVNDSKQLSPAKRAALAPLIKQSAIATSLGVQSSSQIDRVNIYEATRLAMKAAVNGLDKHPDAIIVDAMQIDVPVEQLKLIKGDAKSISVSAASILAKVYRDQLMDQYAIQYPEYDFENNAGYGTAKHLSALNKFGATPIHRTSFAPVKKLIKK